MRSEDEAGRLDGRVALITGAARGMGRAEARCFASEGARVVVADVLDEGAAVAAELGDTARFVRLDVTSESGWADAVDATIEAFGRLDVLVNNAGIAEGAPLADTTLDSYRRVTEVNQTGVFLGMRAVIAAMTDAGGGSIVNISSIDGMVAMDNVIAYVASKWAVRGMTKAAAMELAPRGIRVNSIHPGFVHTSIGTREGLDQAAIHAGLDAFSAQVVPMGRAGEPEEIALLALFLASDESSFCTGSEFVADGGLTAGVRSPGSQAPD